MTCMIWSFDVENRYCLVGIMGNVIIGFVSPVEAIESQLYKSVVLLRETYNIKTFF